MPPKVSRRSYYSCYRCKDTGAVWSAPVNGLATPCECELGQSCVVCDTCAGSGVWYDLAETFEVCSTCNGNGVRRSPVGPCGQSHCFGDARCECVCVECEGVRERSGKRSGPPAKPKPKPKLVDDDEPLTRKVTFDE